ncbi:hypothetical protein IW492_09420 [Enterococcus sp. BWB1-3]|uniref:hypothetical protein n=1 Tax=unclassified Enterococcus TaxID=2608891 RepID=UPI001921FB75|nr:MULTISPECIES: hypothetical protein [unclassified Enterococcus]MBL1229449.1 hypothetical protein [Enterococcus sp. BWB1-3]MCB5952621.1 hypothetical protein [Enterococcus sp. BWT-B8]MCB5956310.1 hypothetical protein [Enterococcus sp. CWB-B31]
MEKMLILTNEISRSEQGKEFAEKLVTYAEEKDKGAVTCYLQQIGPDVADQAAVDLA